MSQKFFWGFRTKIPPVVFVTFLNFHSEAELCSLKKWSNFWHFFKNSRKIEGVTNNGASCTRRNTVLDPTLQWGRFSLPTPQNFSGVKTIFRNFATSGFWGHFRGYTTDNYFLCCFLQRTKFRQFGAPYRKNHSSDHPSFSLDDRVVCSLQRVKKNQKSIHRKLVVFEVEYRKFQIFAISTKFDLPYFGC